MPKTVLVVDDHASIRQMVCFALQMQNLTVLEAEDGSAAMERLAAESIDLVVTDWKMPRMDGLELVRQLRQNKNLAETPVIIVSCVNNLAAQREARELGVLLWLKKPFRMTQIQGLVETALAAGPLQPPAVLVND